MRAVLAFDCYRTPIGEILGQERLSNTRHILKCLKVNSLHDAIVIAILMAWHRTIVFLSDRSDYAIVISRRVQLLSRQVSFYPKEASLHSILTVSM